METKIKQFIADFLDVNLEEVTREALLSKDLGADMLDTVEIVMWLEREFNCHIPDEKLDNFGRDVKVGQLIDLVALIPNKKVVAPKTRKTIKKRVLKFTEYTYDDGTISLKPNTKNFNDFELVGLLSYFHDVFKVKMMQGNMKKND